MQSFCGQNSYVEGSGLQLVPSLCQFQGSQVNVKLQEKEKWSKEKFEIANKAKTEASRLSALEQEAQDKAK